MMVRTEMNDGIAREDSFRDKNRSVVSNFRPGSLGASESSDR